jgi:hypothetical protein
MIEPALDAIASRVGPLGGVLRPDLRGAREQA